MASRNKTAPMLRAVAVEDPTAQGSDFSEGSDPCATVTQPVDASVTVTQPDGPPSVLAHDDEAAERYRYILRNMKPARVWSPEPEVKSESAGSAFVAYQTVAHAAKKQPDQPAPKHVVEIADTPPPRPPVGAAATVVDFGTAIELAAKRERIGRDAAALTVPIVRKQIPMHPSGWSVFGITIVILLAIIGVFAIRFGLDRPATVTAPVPEVARIEPAANVAAAAPTLRLPEPKAPTDRPAAAIPPASAQPSPPATKPTAPRPRTPRAPESSSPPTLAPPQTPPQNSIPNDVTSLQRPIL